MSRKIKLIDKFLSIPNDLTWEELIKILSSFGYDEMTKGKTSGSRRKFVNANRDIILLHKPHPGNVVKLYAIRQVIDHLKAKGFLKDE
jgi:hypothetical protein